MSLRRSLRKNLLAGLIVIAPITATVFVLWWIFQLVDNLIGRWIYPVLPFPIPGLGLVTLLLLLLTVGWLASRAVGGRIIGAWNRMLETLPVTRRIYSAANRIVRTVLGAEAKPFKTVVLVEYPSEGRWVVGFLSGAAPPVIRSRVPEAVSVFVPTTPNPTTGYLVIVAATRVVPIEMSIDDAFTFILSAGSVRFDAVAPASLPPVADPT